MSYRDYYQLLDVDRSASQEEVQKAFKKLARRYHPDVNKEAGAEDRFKDLNSAYDVLKDPEKRALYDKYGASWKAVSEGRAPPSAGFDFRDLGVDGVNMGGGDLGSIFEELFAAQRGRRRGRARGPSRGADQETSLQLGVQDAFAGGAREIAIQDASTGQVSRLSVKIPAGVANGQRIRLGGKGSAGSAGGTPGDLYLEIQVVPDARFKLEGDDVHVTLPITPWEAVLGTTAAVMTLDTEVRLKIPPGTSSGRAIRLREKGYPKKDGGRGDLYCNVQITVPPEPTDEEKALFEELAAKSTFKAR